MNEPSPFRGIDPAPSPVMPQPKPLQELANGLLPRSSIAAPPLPVPAVPSSATPASKASAPASAAPLTPAPHMAPPAANPAFSPAPSETAPTSAPAPSTPPPPANKAPQVDRPAVNPFEAVPEATPPEDEGRAPEPSAAASNAPEATNTQKPAILTMIVLALCFGFLTITGAGTYLYFNWAKHFPPASEPEETASITKQSDKADENTDAKLNRSGIPGWTEELSGLYSGRANVMTGRMEQDLTNARSKAVTDEAHLRTPSAATQTLPRKQPSIADIQKALGEAHATSKSVKPASPAPTAASPNGAPLKSGGTIEQMTSDWLPPGVTKSE